jgi:hypothetical protein
MLYLLEHQILVTDLSRELFPLRALALRDIYEGNDAIIFGAILVLNDARIGLDERWPLIGWSEGAQVFFGRFECLA